VQRLSIHSGVVSWGRAQAKQLTQIEAVSFQKKQSYFSGMASCSDSDFGLL